MVISDKAAGLADAQEISSLKLNGSGVWFIGIEFLSINVLDKHVKTAAAMLKAIHAQEDKEAAREKTALFAANCGL